MELLKTVIENVVDDTTPVLGGDLDLDGHALTGLDISDDTTPVLGGTLDGDDNVLKQTLLQDTAQKTQALGSLSANTAIDIESGNITTFTVGASLTLSFTNWAASPNTSAVLLKITNGSAYTLTLPGAITWDKNSVPTLNSAGTDWLLFWTNDAGSTIYGKLIWSES